MLIAIDFDDTFTKDVGLWLNFTDDCRKRKHDVIIVTSRNKKENEQVDRQLKGTNLKVFYTDYKAKRKHMNSLGIFPDIWIDDHPEYISKDYESIADWEK